MTLLLAVVASYYISVVLSQSDGPYGTFYKLRDRYDLFRCTTCVAFWVSLVISIILFPHAWLLYAFGIAGIVVIIDRLVV